MKILSCLIAALLLCAAPALAQTGFLNVQKLIVESKEGKKASQKLQELKQKKEKELGEKKQELDKLKDEIAKLAKDGKDVTGQVKDFAEKEKDFKRMAEDAELEFKTLDRELTEEFLKKASPVLAKVAKEKKYTMVVTNPTVIGYVSPSVDLTDEVLKELDKGK